jgi:GcrA cell cycle regulator
VDALRRGFAAGLSCGQIAREIGVSRNAVIGKMNRLGLRRAREAPGRQAAASPKDIRPPRRHNRLRGIWRRERPATVTDQRRMLSEAYAEPAAAGAEVTIRNGRGCTLLELGRAECRWPISAPGGGDLRFCANEPVKGLPYCIGHARLAYRPAGARMRSA